MRRIVFALIALSSGALFAADASNRATIAPAPSAPKGFGPAHFNIPGARASATLATAVHCTNLDATAVDLYVDFFDFDASYVCGTSFLSTGSLSTRTFSSTLTAAFSEDSACASTVTLSQGLAVVRSVPVTAKIVCSAEIVSVAGDPPTTLGALDVYPAQ